jgi:hypothetical protein
MARKKEITLPENIATDLGLSFVSRKYPSRNKDAGRGAGIKNVEVAMSHDDGTLRWFTYRISEVGLQQLRKIATGRFERIGWKAELPVIFRYDRAVGMDAADALLLIDEAAK